jgi:hypothetical protein
MFAVELVQFSLTLHFAVAAVAEIAHVAAAPLSASVSRAALVTGHESFVPLVLMPTHAAPCLAGVKQYVDL